MTIFYGYCRLSRARRVIENAYGLLVARWRIFKTEINSDTARVESLVRGTLVLHNLLIEKLGQAYNPDSFVNRRNARTNEWEGGHWRSEIGEGLPSISNRSGGRVRANNEAWNVRESFKDY